MSNPKDCYQVKVDANMTNELKCLYEKLGVGMFNVKLTCPFDPALEVPDLNPEILEVEFDKCDHNKVTFTLYVELPNVTLPDVDDNLDGNPDMKVMPVEHQITTSGHLKPVDITTFTVYPLPSNITGRAFETECYGYEICRVPCKYEEMSNNAVLGANSFRVTFPLSKDVACLIPDFGLSGFYLKNLISTSVKAKVRLVPGNIVPEKGTGQIPGGLLTYDPDRCEACLEFCESEYECIIEGYEHLFNVNDVKDVEAPTLETMALSRRFDVKGVAKCTEKTLFSFELCYKPPLVENEAGLMNYRLISNTPGDYCTEFAVK
jgi:hypothetical protein